ncbi:MAG: leucine-rich repeat domain-containing protein [Chitinophagales bacterium]|nr:leucine-rich repeat domain-containing protein [Chitinophagales bacterium]
MKQISLFFVPIMAFFLTFFSTNLMGQQCYFADLPLVEQQSLTDLYTATHGNNWYFNDNWGNYSVPISEWWGVTVENCSVVTLSSNGNNLSGSLPNLDMPNLRELYLYNNHISSNIPNFNLPNLQIMILSNNQLSGSIPDFNMPNLIGMDLSENQLSGSIPDFNMPNLQTLHLSDNQLSGSIPNFSMPNLQTLHLYGNQLSGSIPNFSMPNLIDLFLGNNYLTDTIPNFNLPNLIGMDLANNQLSGSIPNFNLPNLISIGLYNNQLSGSIPNFNLPNLEWLSLHKNQLNGSIPNFNLPNLRYLHLHHNQLSDSIPNFNLPNLERLYLYFNQLSGSIPNFNLPNLRYLHLHRNALSGSIPNFNLPNLYTLSLHNNQLTGAIPEFTNLPNLNHFTACPNNFAGAIPTFQYCSPIKTFSSSDFTVCVNTAMPTPPTVTVSNITNQSATLSWTSVPDAVSYVIKGRVVGSSNWQTINANGTTQTFSTLQPCTTYQYKVCSVFSNNGYTTFSAVGNFTTTGCGNSGKTTDLEIPTNLTAQQIGNALQIQFNTDKEETVTLQLYNSMGQMVEQTSNAVSIGENDFTMPLNGQVTAGVYLLQIHTPTQHRTLHVSLF